MNVSPRVMVIPQAVNRYPMLLEILVLAISYNILHELLFMNKILLFSNSHKVHISLPYNVCH